MRLVLLVSLLALLVAPAAGAARLGWDEAAKDGKTPVMGFRVDNLTFGSSSWSAHVTLTNLSKKTITIGDRFGAAIFSDGTTEDPQQAIGFAVALRFSPARPKELAPGAKWTGTIGGDGQLKASGSVRYARLVFGPLKGLPGQKHAVYWVTDHRLALAPSGAGGTVI